MENFIFFAVKLPDTFQGLELIAVIVHFFENIQSEKDIS